MLFDVGIGLCITDREHQLILKLRASIQTKGCYLLFPLTKSLATGRRVTILKLYQILRPNGKVSYGLPYYLDHDRRKKPSRK